MCEFSASDGPILVFSGSNPLAGRPTVAGCALPGTAKNQNHCLLLVYFPGLSVRQHLVHVARIGRRNLLHFFQAAHAICLLRAQQVALAGMHAHHFARRRNFETFGGAAMRLKLQFLYFFCHESFLVSCATGFFTLVWAACLVLLWAISNGLSNVYEKPTG